MSEMWKKTQKLHHGWEIREKIDNILFYISF